MDIEKELTFNEFINFLRSLDPRPELIDKNPYRSLFSLDDKNILKCTKLDKKHKKILDVNQQTIIELTAAECEALFMKKISDNGTRFFVQPLRFLERAAVACDDTYSFIAMPKLIILDLSDIILRQTVFIYSVLTSLVVYLGAFNKDHKFVHYDLHLGNIAFSTIDEGQEGISINITSMTKYNIKFDKLYPIIIDFGDVYFSSQDTTIVSESSGDYDGSFDLLTIFGSLYKTYGNTTVTRDFANLILKEGTGFNAETLYNKYFVNGGYRPKNKHKPCVYTVNELIDQQDKLIEFSQFTMSVNLEGNYKNLN